MLHSLPPRYKGFVLNYNMQGMTKSLSELFAMLKTAEVKIKKEHNVLLVNKTTNFKKSSKSAKGLKGKKTQKDGKDVAGPPRAPKVKPGVKCFYCKGVVTGSATAPSTLKTRRSAQLLQETKVYLIYIISILQVPIVTHGYSIPVLLLTSVIPSRI
jgi:hypothetical protein